jgi:hypothetical protein
MRVNLDQVSQRIEVQLTRLEQSLIANTRRLKMLESYAAERIDMVRASLPVLPESSDWERRLLHTVDMLGEIEDLLSKFDGVNLDSLDRTNEISLEEIMDDVSV